MDDPKNIVTYRIEPRPSRFTIQVTAGGLLSAFGHNPVIAVRDFSGQAQFDPGAPESATLHVEAQASSLEVAGDVSDKDRREIERMMQGQVLESADYPTITFDSTGVKTRAAGPGYRAEISGQLTLHGVTSDQFITARVTVAGDRLRASGEFVVLQSDYGIALVTVAGGVLKVKDELKVSFEILASAMKAQDTAAA
jgi:polyisoprenoid-binding protein YceI